MERARAEAVTRPAGPAQARGLAMALMVVASVAISFGGLVMRSIEDADVWQIAFYRSIALITAVAVTLLLRYRGGAVATIRKIGRPGLLGGALLALAGLCFLQALSLTTVANTLFVMSAIPFVTAGLAWLLLGEVIGRATLATMVVAASGVMVMVLEGTGSGSLQGIAMASVTTVCFAGFAVIVRRHRQIDMQPTILASSVIIAVVALILRHDDLGISLGDMLLCFLWGGILSGLANGLFIFASRHLVAAELTLFMLLEFAFGPLWVWLFVGESATLWTLVGGTLVIAAVAARALAELRVSTAKQSCPTGAS